MRSRRSDALTDKQVALLREMARDGLGLLDIAQIAGCGKSTAALYAGDILARNKEARNRAKRAAMLRMVKANECATGPADREEIARRFGLAGRQSLKVRVVYAKRKLGLYDAEARA